MLYEVITARVMELRTYEDLAAIHGKTPQALRKRYERAKKRLAVLLADDYPSYAESGQLESEAIKEKIVITSYSIHYTKLYDCCLP